MKFIIFTLVFLSQITQADVDASSAITGNTPINQLSEKLEITINKKILIPKGSTNLVINHDGSIWFKSEKSSFGATVLREGEYYIESSEYSEALRRYRYHYDKMPSKVLMNNWWSFRDSAIKIRFKNPLGEDSLLAPGTKAIATSRKMLTGNYLFVLPCERNQNLICGSSIAVSVLQFETPNHPQIESIEVNFTAAIPNSRYPEPTKADFDLVTKKDLGLAIPEVPKIESEE